MFFVKIGSVTGSQPPSTLTYHPHADDREHSSIQNCIETAIFAAEELSNKLTYLGKMLNRQTAHGLNSYTETALQTLDDIGGILAHADIKQRLNIVFVVK